MELEPVVVTTRLLITIPLVSIGLFIIAMLVREQRLALGYMLSGSVTTSIAAPGTTEAIGTDHFSADMRLWTILSAGLMIVFLIVSSIVVARKDN